MTAGSGDGTTTTTGALALLFLGDDRADSMSPRALGLLIFGGALTAGFGALLAEGVTLFGGVTSFTGGPTLLTSAGALPSFRI